jgi:geranylgeranyl reductase family protein
MGSRRWSPDAFPAPSRPRPRGKLAGIERFDAIVIGAGPAGSTTALRLAGAGASVLLLDRARFPRDKPCGGGVTVRAARLLPFALDPVVEDVVDCVELRLAFRERFEHRSAQPLVVMTQRRRLDALLAERAAAAGADFRDGVRVTALTADESGVEVDAAGRRFRAAALVGADGVNGISARALDLCRGPRYGVALEGNLSYDGLDPHRYRGRVVFELGNVRGGYGWVFAKADHANFGVGGWEPEAPRLREHLERLCRNHGASAARLTNVRGYRLPVADPSAPLARGRALVVGDAAGLVDPLSGDGIYEAVLSGMFAADAVGSVLEGRAAGLEGYEARVRHALARNLANSWAAKHALDRFPRLLFAIARLEAVQRTLERLARNDPHPAAARRLGRPALIALGLLSRPRVSPAT